MNFMKNNIYFHQIIIESNEIFGSNIKKIWKDSLPNIKETANTIDTESVTKSIQHMKDELIKKYLLPLNIILSFYDNEVSEYILLEVDSWKDFLAQPKKKIKIDCDILSSDGLAREKEIVTDISPLKDPTVVKKSEMIPSDDWIPSEDKVAPPSPPPVVQPKGTILTKPQHNMMYTYTTLLSCFSSKRVPYLARV